MPFGLTVVLPWMFAVRVAFAFAFALALGLGLAEALTLALVFALTLALELAGLSTDDALVRRDGRSGRGGRGRGLLFVGVGIGLSVRETALSGEVTAGRDAMLAIIGESVAGVFMALELGVRFGVELLEPSSRR